MQLQGFHHLTAITAHASENHAFYTATLGLRLVKKTVNQDDVSAYHLFYADGRGSPGSDITFFDWAARPEHRGTHSIARTGFRVDSIDTLKWWRQRFVELNIQHSHITQRQHRPTLDFQDPEGQRLSLAVDEKPREPHPWGKSPVPAQHQLRGLGPVTISVPKLEPTELILTRLMEMRPISQYQSTATDGSQGASNYHVYEMGPGGPAAELHVAVEPNLHAARPGAGGVHHVAFRVPTFEQYDAWNDRLKEFRVPSSGPVDRFYFRSLYFREPSGILFELATDGPGFNADEPMDQLGQHLSLPPFLESRRLEIEANLKPL